MEVIASIVQDFKCISLVANVAENAAIDDWMWSTTVKGAVVWLGLMEMVDGTSGVG